MGYTNLENQTHKGYETTSGDILNTEDSTARHIFDTGIFQDITDIAVYTGSDGLKQFDSDDRKTLLDKFDVNDVEEMRRTVGFAEDKPVAGLEAFVNYGFKGETNLPFDITDRKDLKLGNFEEGTAEILLPTPVYPLSNDPIRKTASYEPLKYTADLSNKSEKKDTKRRKPRERIDAVSSTWVI